MGPKQTSFKKTPEECTSSNYKLLLETEERLSATERVFLHNQMTQDEKKKKLLQHLSTSQSQTDNLINSTLNSKAARKIEKTCEISGEISLKSKREEELLLHAMEYLFVKDCILRKKLRDKDLSNIVLLDNTLRSELELERKLSKVLEDCDNKRSNFLKTLSRDVDLQTIAVSKFIEKTDFQSQLTLKKLNHVQKQLSNITVQECLNKDMKNIELLNSLSDKRLRLTASLVDLISQREVRKEQIFTSVIDSANESLEENSNDDWLSKCDRFLEESSPLHPSLIHQMAQFGVAHCVSALVDHDLRTTDLANINEEKLREAGITLELDRSNVLKAIEKFKAERMDGIEATAPKIGICENVNFQPEPSAPSLEFDLDETDFSISSVEYIENECVICMDTQSEVVFLPCGHLCVCLSCHGSVQLCPICRATVQKRISTLLI